MWYGKKIYGESKLIQCAFCEKTSTTMNKQKVPVCVSHIKNEITGWKCACGKYLDGPLSGKYGVFFNCFDCGNINFKKAKDMQEIGVKYKLNKR